nr:MAG TPA: hypothetical protein [Caudoviricetes sp.]
MLSTAPKPVAQGVSERCLIPKHRWRSHDGNFIWASQYICNSDWSF